MKFPKIREAKRVKSLRRQEDAERANVREKAFNNEYVSLNRIRQIQRQLQEAEHKHLVPLHAEDIIQSGEQLAKFMNKVKPKVYARRLSKKLKEGKALLSRNNSEVIADKILAPEIADRITSFL